MKRPKLTVVIALFCAITAKAQLRFPVTNNGLRNDLQKVISDYLNDFASLKGNVLVQNPQTVEYASLIQFSGAEENRITKYNSTKSIYSWQAIMLTTENFDDAATKYKWLCNQLKSMTITLNDNSFSLYGDYEDPVETKKFSTTEFRLLPSATTLPKLKIEVNMQYEFPDWKVNLQVYQKEREDNEQGPAKED
ncbi:MAG: hypothetical protein ACJ748_03000 [Flavisolibacter sp.]